ncbi:hypothetical protein CRD59_07685, partial [Bifidobacterium xylocopae]
MDPSDKTKGVEKSKENITSRFRPYNTEGIHTILPRTAFTCRTTKRANQSRQDANDSGVDQLGLTLGILDGQGGIGVEGGGPTG